MYEDYRDQKHGFLRLASVHRYHNPELGRPSRADNPPPPPQLTARWERELLDVLGVEAHRGPHVCADGDKENRRQPGSGIELQLVGPGRFGSTVRLSAEHTLNGTPYTVHGCRAPQKFKGIVSLAARTVLWIPIRHARLRAYRPAQESRESRRFPLASIVGG